MLFLKEPAEINLCAYFIAIKEATEHHHSVFHRHPSQKHQCLFSMQAKNGHLDSNNDCLEMDRASFHGDESGRIIHISAENVR